MPLLAHTGNQHQRLRHPVFQQFGRRDVIGVAALAQRQIAAFKKLRQLIAQGQLVAQTKLDVDALDAIGVLSHARQRNDHVLIDLEGVGVAGNRRRLFAIQPELLARLGADGDKALAAARIGNAHHFRRGAGHGVGVVAGDISKQRHLGKSAALTLGGVPHRLEVPVIQMFQAGQHDAGALLLGKHEILDFHDAGHRVTCIAEKLQAYRSRMGGHAVHHPACAGDQAITTFLLDAGQAAEELVRHVLAKPLFAKGLAGYDQLLSADRCLAIGLEIRQRERRRLHVMDLAHAVAHAGHFQPFSLRRHHAPAGQVVECGTPQHGLLAACIHGNIAAHAGGLGRGRVYGENKTTPLSGIGHALRHDTGFSPHRGHRVVHAGQREHLDLGHGFEFFGIDDSRFPGQGNRTAGVAGAAAPGNDGQPQINTALDQARHFFFRVRGQHHEGVLDAPVGGIGHMRHARQAVKLDVVLGSQSN